VATDEPPQETADGAEKRAPERGVLRLPLGDDGHRNWHDSRGEENTLDVEQL